MSFCFHPKAFQLLVLNDLSSFFLSYSSENRFDGPAHFTRQCRLTDDFQSKELPRALGHTVLKYKLLKKQGWTVVRVPYYEFDRIPFWASMERQRYLQRKLKTHEHIKFSGIDVSEYKNFLNDYTNELLLISREPISASIRKRNGK